MNLRKLLTAVASYTLLGTGVGINAEPIIFFPEYPDGKIDIGTFLDNTLELTGSVTSDNCRPVNIAFEFQAIGSDTWLPMSLYDISNPEVKSDNEIYFEDGCGSVSVVWDVQYDLGYNSVTGTLPPTTSASSDPGEDKDVLIRVVYKLTGNEGIDSERKSNIALPNYAPKVSFKTNRVYVLENQIIDDENTSIPIEIQVTNTPSPSNYDTIVTPLVVSTNPNGNSGLPLADVGDYSISLASVLAVHPGAGYTGNHKQTIDLTVFDDDLPNGDREIIVKIEKDTNFPSDFDIEQEYLSIIIIDDETVPSIIYDELNTDELHLFETEGIYSRSNFEYYKKNQAIASEKISSQDILSMRAGIATGNINGDAYNDLILNVNQDGDDLNSSIENIHVYIGSPSGISNNAPVSNGDIENLETDFLTFVHLEQFDNEDNKISALFSANYSANNSDDLVIGYNRNGQKITYIFEGSEEFFDFVVDERFVYFDESLSKITINNAVPIKVADLNQDGFDDLFVNYNEDLLMIYGSSIVEKTGSPILEANDQLLDTVSFSEMPDVFAVGDLDGDGFSDLVYSNGNVIKIARGEVDFSSTITSPLASSFSQISFSNPVSDMAIGDTDGDGIDDLVVSSNSEVLMFLGSDLQSLLSVPGSYNGSLEKSWSLIQNSKSSITLGKYLSCVDANGDGYKDVIISEQFNGAISTNGVPPANYNIQSRQNIIFGRSDWSDWIALTSPLDIDYSYVTKDSTSSDDSFSIIYGDQHEVNYSHDVDLNHDGLPDLLMSLEPRGDVDQSEVRTSIISSGNQNIESTSITKIIKAGAATVDFGSTARFELSYEDGSGPDTQSTTDPSGEALSIYRNSLDSFVILELANVYWELTSDRESSGDFKVEVKYLDTEVQDLVESELALFWTTSQDPEMASNSEWHLVNSNDYVLNTNANLITATISGADLSGGDKLTITLGETSSFIDKDIITWLRADVGLGYSTSDSLEVNDPIDNYVLKWNDWFRDSPDSRFIFNQYYNPNPNYTNAPQYVQNCINGKPAVYFFQPEGDYLEFDDNDSNSSNDVLLDEGDYPDGVEIFIVHQPAKVIGVNEYGLWRFNDLSTHYPKLQSTAGLASQEIEQDFGHKDPGYDKSFVPSFDPFSPHLYSVSVDENEFVSRVNGVVTASVKSDPTRYGFTNNNQLLGKTSNGAPYNGCIAEIIIFDGVLSDSSRREIEQMLISKYELESPPELPDNNLNFRASALADSAIGLYWNSGDGFLDFGTKYEIQRKIVTSNNDFQTITIVDNRQSFIDTNCVDVYGNEIGCIIPGELYSYRIRVNTGNGASEWAPEVIVQSWSDGIIDITVESANEEDNFPKPRVWLSGDGIYKIDSLINLDGDPVDGNELNIWPDSSGNFLNAENYYVDRIPKISVLATNEDILYPSILFDGDFEPGYCGSGDSYDVENPCPTDKLVPYPDPPNPPSCTVTPFEPRRLHSDGYSLSSGTFKSDTSLDLSSVSEGEIILVLRSYAIEGQRYTHPNAPDEVGRYSRTLYRLSGNETLYPFAHDSRIRPSITGGDCVAFYPPVVINNSHIYNVSINNNGSGFDYKGWMNGFEVFNFKDNGAQNFATTPVLGSGSNGYRGFLGEISEFLIFDQPLTNAERIAWSSFLAEKHFLDNVDIDNFDTDKTNDYLLTATPLSGTEMLLTWPDMDDSDIDLFDRDILVIRDSLGEMVNSVNATTTFYLQEDSDYQYGNGWFIDHSTSRNQTYQYRLIALNVSGIFESNEVIINSADVPETDNFPMNKLNFWTRADRIEATIEEDPNDSSIYWSVEELPDFSGNYLNGVFTPNTPLQKATLRQGFVKSRLEDSPDDTEFISFDTSAYEINQGIRTVLQPGSSAEIYIIHKPYEDGVTNFPPPQALWALGHQNAASGSSYVSPSVEIYENFGRNSGYGNWSSDPISGYNLTTVKSKHLYSALAERDGTSLFFRNYLNGRLLSEEDESADPQSGPYFDAKLIFGTSNLQSSPSGFDSELYQGSISEIMITDSILSEFEMESLLIYHSTKHGISDSDDDGLPDWWEIKYITDNDPELYLHELSGFNGADADGDSLSDYQEYLAFLHYRSKIDPKNSDSNGDGINDREAIDSGFDPGSSDPDGDTLDSQAEAGLGTSPIIADTDGDGVDDANDKYPLDPNRNTYPTTADPTSLELISPEGVLN